MYKYFLLFIFLVGCAASDKGRMQYAPTNYKDIVFPEFQYVAPYPGDYRINITDSITLYAVRDTSLPLIDLTFYFKENVIPKNREEVAILQLLSSLYAKGGTETLSPAQVDDSLEFLSAMISGGLASTQSVIHLIAFHVILIKFCLFFLIFSTKPIWIPLVWNCKKAQPFKAICTATIRQARSWALFLHALPTKTIPDYGERIARQ